MLIGSVVRRFFHTFARPFEAARAEYGVSRRDGRTSTGRARASSAPRGPGDIWGPFSEVGGVPSECAECCWML